MDDLQILWVGADGTTWDLLDPFSPVRATAIGGLGLPEFEQQWSTSGAFDGKRYEGTTWNENAVQLQVVVGDAYIPAGFTSRRRGQQWRDLDRAFRRSVSAEVPGQLAVISAVGRRELEVRLAEPLAPPPARNPALIGAATYDLQLVAGDEPWWVGEEVSAEFEWGASSEDPFFGGPTGQSLLWISKRSETNTASIANPGDRPVLARWWAGGPFEGLTFGVGQETATLPFGLEQEETVRVDSLTQTIVDGSGVSLWPRMGFVDPTFAAIPPGESVPLVVEIAGAERGALIGLAFRPLYESPW